MSGHLPGHVSARPCLYAHVDECRCLDADGQRDPARCPRLHPVPCAACAAGVPLNEYGIHSSYDALSSVCTDPASAPLHILREQRIALFERLSGARLEVA